MIKINNDIEAEELAREIKQRREKRNKAIEKLNGYKLHYEDFYNKQIEEENKDCDKETEEAINALMRYFEKLDNQGNTKTLKTEKNYKLPSGKLKYKLDNVKLQPTEELLDYLKENNLNEYIKVNESPMWGEFKKDIKYIEGQVVNKDGEIITQGVKTEVVPATFDLI